jgi:hypothetical protein
MIPSMYHPKKGPEKDPWEERSPFSSRLGIVVECTKGAFTTTNATLAIVSWMDGPTHLLKSKVEAFHSLSAISIISTIFHSLFFHNRVEHLSL